MGVVQQVADTTIGALGEGAVLHKMTLSPTGETSFEDPVKVRIGGDELHPPMEGVTGESYPRARGEEGRAAKEFDVVATLEAHNEEGMENDEGDRRRGSYTRWKGMTNLGQEGIMTTP